MGPFQLRRLQLYDAAKLCSIYLPPPKLVALQEGQVRGDNSFLNLLIFYSVGVDIRVPCPAFLLLSCTYISMAERERNPRTNRKARKENETKKAELRAVLSRVMFC